MSNSISFVGRLGQDAETKSVGEHFVAEFTVGETVYMGKDKEKQTNWYRVSLWNQYAKSMVPHLVKGKEFFFRAELVLRKWEKDDKKGLSPELKDVRMDFVGGKGEKKEELGPDGLPF